VAGGTVFCPGFCPEAQRYKQKFKRHHILIKHRTWDNQVEKTPGIGIIYRHFWVGGGPEHVQNWCKNHISLYWPWISQYGENLKSKTSKKSHIGSDLGPNLSTSRPQVRWIKEIQLSYSWKKNSTKHRFIYSATALYIVIYACMYEGWTNRYMNLFAFLICIMKKRKTSGKWVKRVKKI
jgi:hypothetical protein